MLLEREKKSKKERDKWGKRKGDEERERERGRKGEEGGERKDILEGYIR